MNTGLNKKEPVLKVNWDDIKSRMDFLQDALSRKIERSPEEKRMLLKTRAQSLAIEKKDETTQGDFVEIIEFRLASEVYAVETSFVREVYPLKDYTVLPGVPAFVLGIINVRGQIISVINLKKFFGLPEKGISELNKVIIIQNENMEFGILADIVQNTCSISLDSIQTEMLNTNGISSEYLKGVTSEHLIILDAGKILEDEKITINQINN